MTDALQIESAQPRKRARKQSEPPDFYATAVAEAKQIKQTAETDRMRLGELAAGVVTVYDEETLKKFAKETDWALCTLQRSRSVWRAWAEIKAAPPKLYSVAEALQAHPNRADIIEREPDITTRRARKLMREYKQSEKREDPESRLKQYHKWFTDAVKIANAAEPFGEIVDDSLDLERRKVLRQAIEPKLLDDLRKGGNALIQLADFLQQLLDEATPT